MSPLVARRAIIAIVLLQALVLCALPLFAGARMSQGANVLLSATATTPDDVKGVELPSNEVWLDYGFDDVDVPPGIKPGDTAYLELLDATGNEPARLGTLAADPADLPDGATWIKLPIGESKSGDAELQDGPIDVWWDEDLAKVDELRDELDDDGRVIVMVTLDNDGDPVIDQVVAA